MFFLFLPMLFGFPFFEHPDSVDVVVENHLQNRSITTVCYIISGTTSLHFVPMETALQPESTLAIRVPYSYIDKFIFVADDASVYTLSDYPATTRAEDIVLSLALKNFGGIFEKVYGSYPLVLRNATDVNIVSVSLAPLGDDVLGRNLLLPGEVVRLWLDSAETVQISATDSRGNRSTPFTATTAYPDTVFDILPQQFFDSGEEFGYTESATGTWLVNCVTLGRIVKVEAFSPDGCFIDGIDCASSPLELWDRVFIQNSQETGYVVCTDEIGRTYSANTTDSSTGYYIICDLNLDFGFGFPE